MNCVVHKGSVPSVCLIPQPLIQPSTQTPRATREDTVQQAEARHLLAADAARRAEDGLAPLAGLVQGDTVIKCPSPPSVPKDIDHGRMNTGT